MNAMLLLLMLTAADVDGRHEYFSNVKLAWTNESGVYFQERGRSGYTGVPFEQLRWRDRGRYEFPILPWTRSPIPALTNVPPVPNKRIGEEVLARCEGTTRELEKVKQPEERKKLLWDRYNYGAEYISFLRENVAALATGIKDAEEDIARRLRAGAGPGRQEISEWQRSEVRRIVTEAFRPSQEVAAKVRDSMARIKELSVEAGPDRIRDDPPDLARLSIP